MDKLKKDRYRLLFAVRRSQRYHEHRRRFFDRIHRFVTGVGVFAGTAAAGAVIGQVEWLGIALAGSVAAFSAMDLVVGSAMKARDHHDFERRWIALEQKILNAGDYPMEELVEFRNERLRIEADEPPILRVLDVICHNEVVRSEGRREYERPIGPLQRAFSSFFDWRGHAL